MSEQHKGMSHAEAGIQKRVSEAVYPAEILSDTKLKLCSLIARGAWYECLLNMWRDNVASITATPAEFGRIWGCSTSQAKRIIGEFECHKPCTVTHNHARVTLMSRRLRRREKARIQARKRKQRERSHADVTPDVTAKNPTSSISSSSSPSSSPSSQDNKGGKPPPVFISELKTQLDAVKAEQRRLWDKGDKAGAERERQRAADIQKRIREFKP